jgi:hypothetical protein
MIHFDIVLSGKNRWTEATCIHHHARWPPALVRSVQLHSHDGVSTGRRQQLPWTLSPDDANARSGECSTQDKFLCALVTQLRPARPLLVVEPLLRGRDAVLGAAHRGRLSEGGVADLAREVDRGVLTAPYARVPRGEACAICCRLRR